MMRDLPSFTPLHSPHPGVPAIIFFLLLSADFVASMTAVPILLMVWLELTINFQVEQNFLIID